MENTFSNRHKSRKKIIVAGGGLGGLSAAIHCRLAGFEVLLLERSRLGGKAAQIEQNGFLLDPGPSIIILTEIYDAVFRAAGKDPAEYLKFSRLDPITRVFSEGTSGFVDIPSDFEECLETARKISSADAYSLKRLFGILDLVDPHIRNSVFKKPIDSPLQFLSPDLIAAGRRFALTSSYKEFIDQNFESELFRAFFYGFPSYSGQTYFTRSMSPLLIPYYMLRHGVFYPEGGVGAIPRAFERLARELGVEIFEGSAVTSIQTIGSTVSGVEIDHDRVEPCDALISNIDRITTRQMMGMSEPFHPSMSYFTIHWGLNRPLENLAHHMLLIPQGFQSGFESLYKSRSFPNPPIVYLNATSELDPTTAPPGCTNLFAVVSSPACEPHLNWEELTSRGRRLILDSMRKFGWSISSKEVVFERIQTPTYFQKEHGNFKGSLYGPEESERLFGGLFPLRCRDENYKNLFYAGGSVQPGAGLPMVTLSGKFAANLVAKRI